MVRKQFQKAFIGILTAFLLFSLNACLDDRWDLTRISDEIEITPGISAPMAYGVLSIDDFIRELEYGDKVNHFDDSLLYVTYIDSLFSYPASEIINIPNQTFPEIYISTEINIPEWLGSEPGAIFNFRKEKKEEFIFDHNERPDSIKIKTTNIHIQIESGFRHAGNITITSDNILINGQPFERIIQISDPSGNFSYDAEFPIDGATVTLDNSEPGKTTLPFKYDLQLINSGAPVNSGESCTIAISLNNIKFSSIFGFLGDHELLLNSSGFGIGLYNKLTEEGKLLFADPKINVTTDNSYGIPTKIVLSDVLAESEKNNKSTAMVFNGINPFDVNAPNLSQIGQSVKTFVEIDKSNSNIQDLLAIEPESFSYKIKAITNPGNPTNSLNFVTDSSNLKISIEVVLPLWLKAEGLILEDTLDWELGKKLTDASEFIEYLRLGMEAKNMIPMQTNMQVFFADENYIILDSLFIDNDFVLKGATLDANDKVSKAVQENKSVEFTAARIDKIKPTKKLLVRATVSTKDAGLDKYVKFYSYYTIDFKLKFNARLRINSRDL